MLTTGGQGERALQARQQLAVQTFHDAGHQNLRLLQHSMRDAAALLDTLDADMLEHDRAIDHLITTFLALHMAYHGGQLSKDDMKNRGRFSRRFLSKSENKDTPPDALEIIQEQHANCNIEAGYDDVLPVDLGYLLVVEGYSVVIDEAKPSIGANSHPIFFGSFARGYLINNIGSLRITVDDNITTSRQVKFYYRKRVGGIVANNRALVAIKCATS